MTGPFVAPRLAALGAVLFLIAAFAYPFLGHGWRETGGLLCGAFVCGWMSHAMAATLRRQLQREQDEARAARRAAGSRNVRLLSVAPHDAPAVFWPDPDGYWPEPGHGHSIRGVS